MAKKAKPKPKLKKYYLTVEVQCSGWREYVVEATSPEEAIQLTKEGKARFCDECLDTTDDRSEPEVASVEEIEE